MASLSPTNDAERKAILLRAARAVYDWSLLDVAKRASLSVSTVYAAEGRGRRMLTTRDLDNIVSVYKSEGIDFFDDEADGLGIKIRIS